MNGRLPFRFVTKSLLISILTCLSSVSWHYIIFHMITNIYKYLLLKNLPSKIKTYTRRKNTHETVSISASPSTVPVVKFKFLYYAPHQKRQICVYYGVFQTTLHMKRKITLRNMNGHLYCCYQKSPYQLCPHILVFMFKNTHTVTRMFQSF